MISVVHLLRSLTASPALIELARSSMRSGDALTLSELMEWLEGIYQQLSARYCGISRYGTRRLKSG
jgi:hypothetical protein